MVVEQDSCAQHGCKTHSLLTQCSRICTSMFVELDWIPSLSHSIQNPYSDHQGSKGCCPEISSQLDGG